MKLNEITIIVPTKNEARNIPLLLGSLPPECPLIVVDNSADETREIIHAQRPDNTRIIIHPGNIPAARQAGAEAARTAWLLFTDADVHFASDYFGNLNHYETCDLIYGTKASQGQFDRYYLNFKKGQKFFSLLDIPTVSGSNFIIRRNVLEAIGGFDLLLSVNEDSEIGFRVQKSGYEVCFAENLVVFEHDHRRLQRGRLRKTLHSLLRCSLLYLGLFPSTLRKGDWGYWSKSDESNKSVWKFTAQ
ncbi:MAG: glycosyltransferase [Anaerolineae bacterium]|nr:glycosyltransferase [Anaerolineae bacterium]